MNQHPIVDQFARQVADKAKKEVKTTPIQLTPYTLAMVAIVLGSVLSFFTIWALIIPALAIVGSCFTYYIDRAYYQEETVQEIKAVESLDE